MLPVRHFGAALLPSFASVQAVLSKKVARVALVAILCLASFLLLPEALAAITSAIIVISAVSGFKRSNIFARRLPPPEPVVVRSWFAQRASESAVRLNRWLFERPQQRIPVGTGQPTPVIPQPVFRGERRVETTAIHTADRPDASRVPVGTGSLTPRPANRRASIIPCADSEEDSPSGRIPVRDPRRTFRR